MTGAIIYFKEAVKGNENYIKWYIEKFTKKGVDFKLIYVEDIDYNNLPDFAVCRFIAPEVTKKLVEKGVRCFNNSFVSEICNDKLKTYEYVSEKGIEIMPVLNRDCEEFPVVVKSKNGHGGTEVFMVENHRELVEKLDVLKDNYVIQKPCNNLGRDVRVYVIGGKIITAMLRISDKDFRSNFCLGGRAEVYNLSDEEREKVEKVIRLFDFDFVGIDFIFNNGKMVFNEIEDVVGSRMVYTYTDIDIVEMYVDYILEKVVKCS